MHRATENGQQADRVHLLTSCRRKTRTRTLQQLFTCLTQYAVSWCCARFELGYICSLQSHFLHVRYSYVTNSHICSRPTFVSTAAFKWIHNKLALGPCPYSCKVHLQFERIKSHRHQVFLYLFVRIDDDTFLKSKLIMCESLREKKPVCFFKRQSVSFFRFCFNEHQMECLSGLLFSSKYRYEIWPSFVTYPFSFPLFPTNQFFCRFYLPDCIAVHAQLMQRPRE